MRFRLRNYLIIVFYLELYVYLRNQDVEENTMKQNTISPGPENRTKKVLDLFIRNEYHS